MSPLGGSTGRSSAAKRLPVNPRRHRVAPEQRKRVATACNSCNVRRVRCSGDSPCQQCRASSRDCIYPIPVEKVSVPRAELEDLRKKVASYENALRVTVPDDLVRQELLQRSVSMKPEEADFEAPLSTNSKPFHDTASQCSDGPSTNNNDEVQEPTEGRLLHDPDGNTRFLGETSGATFLDYLKEFMRAILPLTNQDSQVVVEGNEFLSSLGSYQTYDSRPLHEGGVDPLWLPQCDNMENMLRELRYFILDGNGEWPSGGIYWWGDLDSLPRHPEPATTAAWQANSESYRHLAFYHTAFAVIDQALTTKPPSSDQESYPSESYFNRARLLLGNPHDITRFTINDVACLTLMGFYLIEMNRRDAAYMYVSSAMHISIMHGAHRGWVDERGKRVFWTLYVLDRWLSCLMGRPPAIMDDAIRVPLPCDTAPMPPAAGLRAHVELSRISGHIVCNTYRVSPWQDPLGAVRQLESAINMLDCWRSRLPARLQLDSCGLSTDPACCLLHMSYNQLILLTIRPIFFAAVKRVLAERLITRQSSLGSHPKLAQLRRCVAAAQHNIQLARYILVINRPRKLLQAGLHFIFNAAICLMLQELVYLGEEVNSGNEASPSQTAGDDDVDFVIARFEDESRIGSNYGRDCATVLRDLRLLVRKLKALMNPAREAAGQSAEATAYAPAEDGATALDSRSLVVHVTTEELQPVQVEQGHALYDELVSWMDDDWHSYIGFSM